MADNRIAYGLAKKYGIDTTGMSPKEVWEALRKKGVTEKNIADGAYNSQEGRATVLARQLMEKRKREEEEAAQAKKEPKLTEDENRQLNEYEVPREPVVRKKEDAEKWARYDRDYDTYKAKEPAITADMDEIAKETGMPLIGRDFRLKGKGSYDRKVNDKRLNSEYKPLGDVVRYTFQHSLEYAPSEIKSNLKMLRQKGYKVVSIDNKWKDEGSYNGINVDIVSPSGVPMEIQYLTLRNAELKEKFHKYYEISRDTRTPEKIKSLSDRKMKELSRFWEEPKGIKEI